MIGITRLEAQNVKRLKAVEITPDGNLVVIGGANAAGKTSVLDAIAMAFGGKDAVPAQPIRQGSTNAQIIVETEELIVTRRFSASGGSTLEVRNREGVKLASPQAQLDALLSRVSFDPLEFTRMNPAKQLETVRTLAGLDFSALDTEYREKYEQRTLINRNAKTQEARFQAITRTDAPTAEVSVSALASSLEAAQRTNGQNEKARDSLSNINDLIDGRKDTIHSLVKKIEELEKELQAAKASLVQEEKDRDAAKTATDALQDVDTAPILQQIREAEATNIKVRANAQWTVEHRSFVALQQQSQALTERLEAIASEKQEKLSAASFPVEGLSFTDTGVSFRGVPFEQSSGAEQLRVSLAIATSLNPKLPVMLIRDGSLLDEKSMALVAEHAERVGAQVWIEVVGNREDCSVIIEDGQVLETRPTKKK